MGLNRAHPVRVATWKSRNLEKSARVSESVLLESTSARRPASQGASEAFFKTGRMRGCAVVK